jgi:hypothetical protein
VSKLSRSVHEGNYGAANEMLLQRVATTRPATAAQAAARFSTRSRAIRVTLTVS